MKKSGAKKKSPQVCPLERKKTDLRNRLLILQARLDREGLSPMDNATQYATELEMRRLHEFLRELQDTDELPETPLRSIH